MSVANPGLKDGEEGAQKVTCINISTLIQQYIRQCNLTTKHISDTINFIMGSHYCCFLIIPFALFNVSLMCTASGSTLACMFPIMLYQLFTVYAHTNGSLVFKKCTVFRTVNYYFHI